jgi:hypothetical protein
MFELLYEPDQPLCVMTSRPSILPSKIGAEHFHALKISTQQPFFIYFVGHYCCGQLLLHLDWCIE